MANLKIPTRTLNDEFLLEDYQDDFNALNTEINELKTRGRLDELVIGNEAFRIYQVNDEDVELYSRLDKLSVGCMNKDDTNTVGFVVEPTDINNGFQIRPYQYQYMNIGASNDDMKINDIYSKGTVSCNSVTSINGISDGTKGINFHPERSDLVRISNGEHSLDFICDNTGRKRLEPYRGGEYDLGGADYSWKDLWLSGFQLDGNGYTKLPNGLLLQWGFVEIKNQNEDMNVTYPIQFPNRCL